MWKLMEIIPTMTCDSQILNLFAFYWIESYNEHNKSLTISQNFITSTKLQYNEFRSIKSDIFNKIVARHKHAIKSFLS